MSEINNPIMVPIDTVSDPSPVPVSDVLPDPVPPVSDPVLPIPSNEKPEESTGSVSDNDGFIDKEEKKEVKDEEDFVSYEPSIITVETHTLDSVSVNTVIDPNDLISVNSVSLNVVSADGLSLNSVSVNVSNNYVSNNYIQIISQNETNIWEKPFKDYTTSEGLLLIIMVTLVLGFVSTHLLKGLKGYGNI